MYVSDAVSCCAVLCCVVLCSLCCDVPCCDVLWRAVLCFAVLCCAVPCGDVLCCAVLLAPMCAEGCVPFSLSLAHASVRGLARSRFFLCVRIRFFACLRDRSTLELEGGTRHPGSQGLDALLRSVSCGVHHFFSSASVLSPSHPRRCRRRPDLSLFPSTRLGYLE